MPPQNGKSLLASHWFPVWLLNLFHRRRFILVSYGAEYAESWGRRVRNTIAAHAADLTVRVAPDYGAAGEWETTDGGGMVSVGIGGSVTGRPADVLLFDDPFKNHEEASSKTQRDKVWAFFLSCAYTRLSPTGAIVVIMTRWDEDDLVGRLDRAEQAGGERWERVNLPAIAEENDALGRAPGEALWPGRWPVPELQRIFRAIGSYFANALYQQRPAPPEGNYFKRAWFQVVPADRVPRSLRKCRAWDLAATVQVGNEDPDWLAGVKIGVDDATGKYYVLHVARAREAPEGVKNTITGTAGADGRDVSIVVEQEGAASGKIVAYHYTNMLDGYAARFATVPKAGKFVRSGPFNAACERGDVVLVEGPWVEAFVDELAAFPTGSHDDQVDAAVGAYEALVTGFVGDLVSEDVQVVN